MNGTSPHTSPMSAIAKESLAMSKETGDKTFKFVAMIMMAASGLATLLHAGHVILRDMKTKREQEPKSGHAVPDRSETQDATQGDDAGPDRSWITKARVGKRAGGPETPWAERRGHRTQSRQL